MVLLYLYYIPLRGSGTPFDNSRYAQHTAAGYPVESEFLLTSASFYKNIIRKTEKKYKAVFTDFNCRFGTFRRRISGHKPLPVCFTVYAGFLYGFMRVFLLLPEKNTPGHGRECVSSVF